MSQADREKWNAKYSGNQSLPLSRVLVELDDVLPRCGRTLDIAGGDGRNAIWLAQRGLDVTVADLADVALEQAVRRAEEAGVVLQTRHVDFDREPLPPGPWDLVVSILFYCPAHFEQFVDVLAPGGLLLYLQPTLRNRERHERPPERYLLKDGELPSLVKGLEIVRYQEGWLADGRHDALLIARRPE